MLSFDKKKIKILLLEGINRSAVEILEADGYKNITVLNYALAEEELIKALADVHILGIRSNTKVTAKALEHAQKLFSIGCFCIGTDQVDLKTAKRAGIPVFNAPFSNTRSVAELVIAEAILLLRGIPEKNALAHQGEWVKSAKNSHEIRGKKIGIIGYGHIGTQVGVMAEALGMQVFYYDIEEKLSLGNAKPIKTLKELCSMADVITIHVADTAQTRHMFGKKEIEAMKKGSILINAARGKVIEVEALMNALEKEHLSGAAIDVFPQEPKKTGEKFTTPLQKFQNVILTPHIGGSTEEAQVNIGTEVATKLLKYSNNGSTLSAVNFVEVNLPQFSGKHRILHIHQNKPGVLGNLNDFFLKNKINIVSQYLQTDEESGYVVMDIDRTEKKEILDELKKIPGTIRARILF